MLAEAFDWNHLPVAGGIYDQHPKLLEDWMVIFHERHLHEEEKKRQEKRTPRKSR